MLHTHKIYGNDPPTERRVLSFCFVSREPSSRILTFAVVKRSAPTKRSVHRGDLVGIAAHRITAIRKPIRRWDVLAHHRKLDSGQLDCGTAIPPKATPVRALALARGGVPFILLGGSLCTFLCAKAPISRGSPEGPARRPVPWGCFFRLFLCRSKEMGTPKIINEYKTISLYSPKSTQYKTPPRYRSGRGRVDPIILSSARG